MCVMYLIIITILGGLSPLKLEVGWSSYTCAAAIHVTPHFPRFGSAEMGMASGRVPLRRSSFRQICLLRSSQMRITMSFTTHLIDERASTRQAAELGPID